MTETLWRQFSLFPQLRYEEMIMVKKDKYNSSGYLDMTAFLALRKIEREEKQRRRQENRNQKRKKSKKRRK